MNKLITKARSGVTLVELLVVILIVTILSVALLPLLKPYIEEAKYAAEPIPVIGALQTKINLFQYEKDYLPCESITETVDCYTWTNTATAGLAPVYEEAKIENGVRSKLATFSKYPTLQINWEDMKGRRMTPEHIQYAVLYGGDDSSKGVAQYAYAIGAFGNGVGLGKGTGFAALTIVDTLNTNKIVATWKRYKPVSQKQVSFNRDGLGTVDEYCHLPTLSDMGFTSGGATPTGTGSKTKFEKLKEVLISAGWDFVDAE